MHFMAYFQGEHLGRGSFLDVCFVNKGENLESCASPVFECAHIGGELHSEGELHFTGSFELFMLFAGCVELCLFLEGLALHMLGCVEHCLFLEGSSMFWSQCVEPLPLSWGLTL